MNKKEVLDAISQNYRESLQDIGATNGEVIKAMLPFVEVIENEHGVFINIQNVLLDKDWWNAPFKAKSEG